VPNVRVCNALISTCEKGRQPTCALKVLESRQRQGVVADVITYNALISACEKEMQPESALKVFESM